MNEDLRNVFDKTYRYINELKKGCYNPIKDLAKHIIEQDAVKQTAIYISAYGGVERMVNMWFENDKLYIELEHFELTLDDLDFEQLYWLLNSLEEFVERISIN